MIVPFVAGAIAPFAAEKIGQQVRTGLELALGEQNGNAGWDELTAPVHLRRDSVADYAVHVSDTQQVLTSMILLLLGLILAFLQSASGPVVGALALVILVAAIVQFKMLRIDPSAYARKKVLGLGVLNGTLLGLNASIALVLFGLLLGKPGVFN